ncbi:MAG: efflux RND transporter periplasmic adaptor subunit [Hormoscilla sp. GUM202]|nr:efflux RND transporter periplasmic adaptor subunit [Hormoscilla sp. GUM202]
MTQLGPSKIAQSFILGKLWPQAILVAILMGTAGCGTIPKQQAEARSNPPPAESSKRKIPVDVAIARPGELGQALEYTGTTEPIKEVSVRSRTEGQLLYLGVDVGDKVTRGQVLAQLDNRLPVAEVMEAQAELSARAVEIARARNQVLEAEARVEQARVELEQANADAQRLQTLFQEGAVSEQDAELAQTAARAAQQILRSAQAQVSIQEKAVAAARKRVVAQQAAIAQAEERQSHAKLISPITGIVKAKTTEPGNLVREGDEIVKLGDFSQVKVAVNISELQLDKISIGQSVQVKLDAFPDREFPGRVTRISPAADPVARQVPVEVTIPNINGRLGSGLLARVSFTSSQNSQGVVVPATALSGLEGNVATLFVVTVRDGLAQAEARKVIIGDRADGQASIASGLEPGERFVVRSSKPLQDGDAVQLSILSESK